MLTAVSDYILHCGMALLDDEATDRLRDTNTPRINGLLNAPTGIAANEGRLLRNDYLPREARSGALAPRALGDAA